MKDFVLRFSLRTNIICLALITVLQLQNSLISCAPEKSAVCNTPECRKLGTNFKKNMNPHGNPCTDFYDYVCHNWGAQHPRLKSDKMWNIDKVMKYRTYHKLKELLESKRPLYNIEFNQAKSLYLACMNLPFLDKSDPKVIQKQIKQAGMWPLVTPLNVKIPPLSWSVIDNHYIAISGESALFDYGVMVDSTMSYKIITTVRQLYSPHGMLKRISTWEGPEKANYMTFLKNVIQTVTSPQAFSAVKWKIEKALDAVLNFREELRKIADAAEDNNHPQIMSIDNFDGLFDKLSAPKGTQDIDWLAKFRAMYKKSLDGDREVISGSTMINVNLNYFQPLAKLLATTPQNVIVNHVHLYFVERHLKLTPQMERQLQDCFMREIFPNGRVRYDPERWFTCIETHSMRTVLGKLYVQTYLLPGQRETAIKLLKDAEKLLKSQISHSNWLTSDMKAKSLEKVSRITHQVGYPPWYDQELKNVTQHGNDVDPITVDAYFVATLNKICISAAYLQYPIFGENLPYVIEYGTTVAMFGHELYHAFDCEGLEFCPKGLVKKWWTPNMYKQYDVQKKCFKSQYDAYRKIEMDKFGVHVQAELSDTVEEDVADVMGLKLAYLGYRNEKALNNDECQVLPGFEKFGCEQMFFIAFANTFCSDSAPAIRKMILLQDLHSLEKIRINGAMANMKEFSAAFGCTEKDPLNIQKRCDLWQK